MNSNLNRLAFMICALLTPGAQAQSPGMLQSQVYVTGLSNPVSMIQDPVDRTVQYVVELAGRIRVIKSGVLQANDFANLTSVVSANGGEQGMFCIAFHPRYASNRLVYVNYIDRSGNTQISRYTRNAANPLLLDTSSAQKVISIAQPFTNHNGGTLRFGPKDGYLYIGMGDGGSGNDPGNRAQTITNQLLGKMLRLDINRDAFPNDANKNYAIPPTNPFVNKTGDDEIWSFGLRNPWKWSFDNPALLGTGGMLIADVGQGAWEEVDYEPPLTSGRNYGWREFEGNVNTGLGGGAGGTYTFPVQVYGHNVGNSITGGYVYRGLQLGDMFGKYFFADFVSSRVWSIELAYNPVTGAATASNLTEHTNDIGTANGNFSSIDVDSFGEIYLLSFQDNGNGKILKVLPRNRAWPVTLSPDVSAPISRELRLLSATDSKVLVLPQIDSPTRASFLSGCFVTYNSNVTAAGQLDVTASASFTSGASNGKVEVLLKNWTTNSWDSVGLVTVLSSPTVVRVTGISATKYVRAAGGAIQVYLKATNFGAGASVSYDQLKVDVR